jgi:hypothetical protein
VNILAPKPDPHALLAAAMASSSVDLLQLVPIRPPDFRLEAIADQPASEHVPATSHRYLPGALLF